MPDETMLTIGGDGKLAEVSVKDWQAYIDTNRKSNPGIRPPGTGPHGEWTVEDEQAAIAQYDENKDYGEGREVWDILADEAGITGPHAATRRALAEKHPDASRIDVDETGQAITYFPEDSAVSWQKDPEDRSIYDLSDGPTPETFNALANGAAKTAIEQASRREPYNRDTWPGKWVTKGFGEWKKEEEEEEED